MSVGTTTYDYYYTTGTDNVDTYPTTTGDGSTSTGTFDTSLSTTNNLLVATTLPSSSQTTMPSLQPEFPSGVYAFK